MAIFAVWLQERKFFDVTDRYNELLQSADGETAADAIQLEIQCDAVVAHSVYRGFETSLFSEAQEIADRAV